MSGNPRTRIMKYCVAQLFCPRGDKGVEDLKTCSEQQACAPYCPQGCLLLREDMLSEACRLCVYRRCLGALLECGGTLPPTPNPIPTRVPTRPPTRFGYEQASNPEEILGFSIMSFFLLTLAAYCFCLCTDKRKPWFGSQDTPEEREPRLDTMSMGDGLPDQLFEEGGSLRSDPFDGALDPQPSSHTVSSNPESLPVALVVSGPYTYP